MDQSIHGPYNSQDNLNLSQIVNVFDDFLEFEYVIRSDKLVGPGVLQIPTIYLHHHFSDITYSSNNRVYSFRVSEKPPFITTEPKILQWLPEMWDWVTMSSTNPQFKKQSYTFISVPSKRMKQLIRYMESQRSNLSITSEYNRYNLSINYIIQFPLGESIHSWFILIPYSYDDTINTPFGRLTVSEFAQRVKDYYNTHQSLLPNEVTKSVFTSARSNSVLWDPFYAFDGKKETVYSSQQYESIYPNENRPWIAGWLNRLTSVSKITLVLRMMNNIPLGFPQNYRVYLTSPDNKEWLYVGSYSDPHIVFSKPYMTYGVLIVVDKLGLDDYNNPFFQLQDIQIN